MTQLIPSRHGHVTRRYGHVHGKSAVFSDNIHRPMDLRSTSDGTQDRSNAASPAAGKPVMVTRGIEEGSRLLLQVRGGLHVQPQAQRKRVYQLDIL